jgi:membrane fusion protein, multidrug efflux system
MARRKAWLILLPALAAALGSGWYFGRDMMSGAAPPRPAVPSIAVTAAAAQRQDLPALLAGIGSVHALNSVTVKVRVDGHLDDVMFTEGQDVAEGDLLAQIDPRPFQALLAQARAAKARDEAQLANARLDLQRSTTLVTRDFVSRQTVDTQRAQVLQLEAAVQADEAAIDNATVQLGYTTIRSPIAGRTGIRLVDRGNIVHATDTNGLVIIAQVRPISVVFALSQDVLGDVVRQMAHGPLKVLAYNRDNTTALGEGDLLLIDNQVDAATGTIRLKAKFDNSNGALWPGQFVNARLLLEVRRDVLTVPAQAVQRGPSGPFVYLIKADQSVEQRPVKTGDIHEGVTVIEAGLAEGDRVVLDGQYKLRAGSRVQVSPAEKPQRKPDAEARVGMAP